MRTTTVMLRSTVAALGLIAAGTVVGTLGVPDLASAQTAGSVASSVVTVDPTRVLDTRSGTGLPGPILANQSSKLQITGSIPTRLDGNDVDQTVVPNGATGVLLNVTALRPDAGGFISIRPGTATGEPSASNLNASAGQVVPNAVTAALAPNGTIDIWYGTATNGARTGILIDIVGYTTEAAAGGAGTPGPTGPAGPQGPAGTDGADGTNGTNGVDGTDGTNGVDATTPDNVVWVASSGGDFTKVSDAIASGATFIKVAPGTYTETSPIIVNRGLTIEGAGPDKTIISCACGGVDSVDAFLNTSDSSTIYATTFDDLTLRNVTVRNTGGAGTDWAIGVKSYQSDARLTNVDIVVSGSNNNVGLADVRIANGRHESVRIDVTGGSTALGYRARTASVAILHNVDISARNGSVDTTAFQADRTTVTASVISASSATGTVQALKPSLTFTTIADTTIIGGSTAGTAPTCFNVRDGSFGALDADCQ